MILDETLVEMLDGEARVVLAVEPLDLLRPVGRNPLARRLAEPPVREPGLTVLLVSSASSAGTSARSPLTAPPPRPGSARPIPSGGEDSKTSPCAPPEGLP